jgi:hypothetical protein
MKNIIPKIPLNKHVNSYLPRDSVNQYSLRFAIRQALRKKIQTRFMPFVAFSLVGLAIPAIAQQATFDLSSLDGNNGFVLNGAATGFSSGSSVSAAGDINDDGVDDLLIGSNGTDTNGSNSGASYVVFGISGTDSDNTVELSTLDGSNGFVLNGVAVGDNTGLSVSAGGDVNNDGIDDLLIGAVGADPNGRTSGASYVVFGSNQGFAASLELSTLDGINGFVINGVARGDFSGDSVSTAGDVNGDGIDDLLIGAIGAYSASGIGTSYVVFGGSEVGSGGTLELSTLDGSNGFVLNGVARDDRTGTSVSAAGDVNGDGVDDLLIGADLADPNGRYSGASYVVFGTSGMGSSGTVELSSLNGNNGFVLNGAAIGDGSGVSVSAAGDVNDDGIDDLLIGASGADPNGSNSGASYVVFGASGVGDGGSLELSALDGNNGFVLNGVAEGDLCGRSVNSAGDVNGDGVDDLLIGAFNATTNTSNSGASYVVFGSSSVGGGGSLELSALDGNDGFVLNGVARDDRSGLSVSAAGDVNSDGIDDLMIGTPFPNENSGASYVVFGQRPDDPVSIKLNSQVSASSDDAEENTATGKINRGSSDLELVDQGALLQLVGMRFNSLSIPQGATISNASIQFQTDETHSGITNLLIEGQATENALTFTNANANISTRDRTNAIIEWDPKSWTIVGETGRNQQTPNIKSVIQEIIERPGWTSGNSLVIIISGSGQRAAESFNGDAGAAPVLHVEYQ